MISHHILRTFNTDEKEVIQIWVIEGHLRILLTPILGYHLKVLSNPSGLSTESLSMLLIILHSSGKLIEALLGFITSNSHLQIGSYQKIKSVLNTGFQSLLAFFPGPLTPHVIPTVVTIWLSNTYWLWCILNLFLFYF